MSLGTLLNADISLKLWTVDVNDVHDTPRSETYRKWKQGSRVHVHAVPVKRAISQEKSENPTEKRYAEALLYLQRRKQQHLAEQRATQTDEES